MTTEKECMYERCARPQATAGLCAKCNAAELVMALVKDTYNPDELDQLATNLEGKRLWDLDKHCVENRVFILGRITRRIKDICSAYRLDADSVAREVARKCRTLGTMMQEVKKREAEMGDPGYYRRNAAEVVRGILASI